MSEEVNKEQTKGAEQEKNTELSDQQLAEAQGGAISRSALMDRAGPNDDANFSSRTPQRGHDQYTTIDGQTKSG